MTIQVVNQGEEAFLDLILAGNYSLKLFKNNVDSGLTTTQKNALTEAGFTEADFTGYSAVTLTGGSWTTTPGDPSTGTYAVQTFTSSANQAAQTIYGYYVTTAGGALRWYETFTAPIVIEFLGESISITPRMTLQDTGD